MSEAAERPAPVAAQPVVEIGDAAFEDEVLERSKSRPVVVDFWAPWCGPCRSLGPLLESLAAEHGGEFVLAKIDVDQAPGVAQAFGVRSIPAVMGFRDGEVVASFVGAQPESAVRAFLEELLPSESDRLAVEAEALRTQGDPAGARRLLDDALERDPRNAAAGLALARLLAEQGEVDAALDQLERVVPRGALVAERDQLSAELRTQRAGAADPDALRAQLEADPDALDPRLELGRALAARGLHEEALEQLLEVVRRDAAHRDGAARQAMVDLFEVLGPEHELTQRFRSALARALYR